MWNVWITSILITSLIKRGRAMSIRKIETISLSDLSTDFAVIYKDTEVQEYRVKFFQSGIYAPEADYFTDSLTDAQGTAKSQIRKPMSESSADYAARQKRLTEAKIATSNDEVRLTRLSRIPGYTEAMKNL